MKKGILFDLDGTLWDSSEQVAVSWKEALEQRPDVDKEITVEMVQAVMGKSMYDIADILFGEYSLDVRRELLVYCCQEENEYIRRHGGSLLEDRARYVAAIKRFGLPSLYCK